MSDQQQNVSDVTPDASGTPEGSPDQTSQDTVKYETYRKVLSEKKRRDEELSTARDQIATYEADKKTRMETDLAEKEDFKKLLEIRDQELAETRTQLTGLTQQTANSQKLDSFLSSLDGKVDRKYWGHIDLKSIVVDPNSGQVDDMSVTKEIERFKKEYPEVIKTTSGPGVPNASPQKPVGMSGDNPLAMIARSGLFGRPV